MNDEVKAAIDAAELAMNQYAMKVPGHGYAEAMRAIERVALAAIDTIDSRHECCTAGCGAIGGDGYCPTCKLCRDAKRELEESMSKRDAD